MNQTTEMNEKDIKVNKKQKIEIFEIFYLIFKKIKLQ
jgi:hypothetical protein